MMHVESSHIRKPFMFPRVRALYASTMLMLLISSTNVLVEVVRMSNTSSGNGPTWLRFLYTRYVAMNVPKNMQSEPRKAHMSSFLWLRPVVVSCSSCPPAWATSAFATYFSV